MRTTKNLRCFPNPFQRLDHEGVPASAYPFDPSHDPDRRWVGAVVDRNEGPDGLPRTRKLETPGDMTAVVKGKVRYVDRAPRKRIQFAFDLDTPSVVPPTGHYSLGFRQGSLIPADEATAKAIGRAFVDPKIVLRAAAERAIAEWEREHGEEPDVSYWPANLCDAAGLQAPPKNDDTKDAAAAVGGAK